jgi:hypothetical protein
MLSINVADSQTVLSFSTSQVIDKPFEDFKSAVKGRMVGLKLCSMQSDIRIYDPQFGPEPLISLNRYRRDSSFDERSLIVNIIPETIQLRYSGSTWRGEIQRQDLLEPHSTRTPEDVIFNTAFNSLPSFCRFETTIQPNDWPLQLAWIEEIVLISQESTNVSSESEQEDSSSSEESVGSFDPNKVSGRLAPQDTSCVICHEPLFGQTDSCSNVRWMKKCWHLFHATCLEQWLTTERRTCPLCRA